MCILDEHMLQIYVDVTKVYCKCSVLCEAEYMDAHLVFHLQGSKCLLCLISTGWCLGLAGGCLRVCVFVRESVCVFSINVVFT